MRYLTFYLHGGHIVWTICELASESAYRSPLISLADDALMLKAKNLQLISHLCDLPFQLILLKIPS